MESLEDWAKKLKVCNKLIIVEGKKDKLALENLGINNILTFSNSPHYSCEDINQEVVILTDLDKHGKKLYSIIKKNLQKRGIKIDKKFREFLFQKKISHIEGIKV